MSVIVGAETMARTRADMAFGEGLPGPRETAQEWLARMWLVVRPVLAPAA